MNRNVMAAMSGGVDSAVAAALLHNQNYNVTGVTLRLAEGGAGRGGGPPEKPDNVEDARKAALSLGIEFTAMDLAADFRAMVLDPFADAYMAGLTPNPCVRCNRFIKFGVLLERALAMGYDFLATGHYARVERGLSSGRYLLKRPLDREKDQTYMLYTLGQHQLSHILFPLGDLKKSHVRRLAREFGLSSCQKPDSQDLCFAGNGRYADFVKTHTGKPFAEGDFIGVDGRVLGRHKGIARYTVGQRKGLGLSLPRPAYVVAKDSARNRVVLGSGDDLMRSGLIAGDCNFIPFDRLETPIEAEACIRYGQKGQRALISPRENGRAAVEFEKPQRAVSPGQAVVFYDGDTVVGGGTILESM